MDTLNVLITLPFTADLIGKLVSISPQLVISQRDARTVDDIADLVSDIDVLYTWQVLPLPDAAPRLRWVQLHGAGIDHLLEHPLFTQSDVMFTTASGIHAITMAEYVLAQMLAFAHRLPRMFEDKVSGTWSSPRWDRYVPDVLHSATVGIVGYGSIGRQIARLAQAFGMRILAIKRDVRQLADNSYMIAGTGDPEGEIPERIYPPQALRSFLRECDYVVLTVPLNQQTYHLINAVTLSAMKPSAVLINVSRGDVVDEAALIEALEKGVIRGAALDVFNKEPLPPTSPLWKLPNVIISPHVAGFMPDYYERAAELFAENLRRFLAGEPLFNLVDRSRGY